MTQKPFAVILGVYKNKIGFVANIEIIMALADKNCQSLFYSFT